MTLDWDGSMFRSGIWLDCSCGWRHDLGVNTTIEVAAAWAKKHRDDPTDGRPMPTLEAGDVVQIRIDGRDELHVVQ